MAYSKEQLVEMYKIMQRARLFDKKISTESRKGKLVGMFHFGTNQEAFEAGLMPCIGKDDYLRPYHRNHGCLSMCDMKLYVAGMLERSTGYNMGIGGDYHQQDIKNLHLLPLDGLIGEDWLHCTGVAMALKLQKKPGVVICVQGDGGAQMGSLYESMNFASLFDLPIVYVIMNNGVAMTTPTEKECKCSEISGRAAGFNVKGVSVWGQDPIAIREVIESAMESARNGQPALVEVMTYRKCGHYFGDPRDYETEERDARMTEKYPDPILRFEKVLQDMGVCTAEELKGYAKEVKKEIAEAFDWAYEQPMLTGDMTKGADKVFSYTEGGKL
ncbi:MAG: thiamine pyrophosphate-dependent dehydrogenase E1 component subunit alpha [Eubacterium sp.]|jgi:TPP-dependent pyruvate/acetoin dehydrogenase alpha subunit|nr:thiamine pyrophosphate-dependent dehydrogenase E1 component subunit alpha [Eubacterium sp.]